MHIQDFNGKKICIIGYQREGQALVEALQQYAPHADITVMSRRDELEVPAGVKTQLGAVNFLQNLHNYDAVVRSGGVPHSPELAAVGSKVTTSTAIFFDSIQNTGVRTIGITGSKGKSTTTTLIYEALRAHDPEHTFLMGNIGIPMITFLADAKPGNTFVLELSSYMLESLRVSPNIAVVTSFFPEHLDHHGTVQNYWNAKKHIALQLTRSARKSPMPALANAYLLARRISRCK
jgi:UDP-N-acetylmuramoylalanine-D-glutamate ligase